MGLFQKPPRTPEELLAAQPLDLTPDEVAELTEEEWYARAYKGEGVPQLTLRAVLLGSVLGFVLAFTNLYVGLKAGWALGVVITAALVAFALWRSLLAIGLAKTPMGVLEMNAMASTASSAGYATGGTMVSAIAALLMLSATPENPEGQHIGFWLLIAWTGSLGFLGTLMAIPMKRNMINQERLRFPTGTAAAVTLYSLYSEGQKAIKKAKALFVSAGIAAFTPLLLLLNAVPDGAGGRKPLLPSSLPVFDWLPAPSKGTKPSDWTWSLDLDPTFLAAGALMGLRVTFAMVLGGLVLYYGIGDRAFHEWTWTNPQGEVVTAITAPGKAWREAGLWFGVSIMVASALMSFALQWKTIVRAFRGMRSSHEEGSEMEALVQRTEVPQSWFVWGSLFFGAVVVWLAHGWFEIPWYYGALAVVMTFVLALVACRATGETDITPTGALGKIMQLTYGVLIPQNATANLMTASISANAAGNSADLLSDLKSGYLLGANPRRQFLAQFMGVIAGTFATVAGFRILVPNAIALNGQTLADGTFVQPQYPAPAAISWRAMAELFRDGLQNLHPMYQQLIFWGLGIGAALVLMEAVLGHRKRWVPSATGLGMGMIIGFNFCISMFLGALIAWFWMRRSPRSASDYLVPVAAGVIAGVSLISVVIAILNNTVLS